MKYFLYTVVLLLFLQAFNCYGRLSNGSSTVNPDTCRPINFNCGGEESENRRNIRPQSGSPGKRGIQGPEGPAGPPGASGPKGEPGNEVDKTLMQMDILQMFGAVSCEELRTKHHVTRSGHYWMRSKDVEWPVYVFCDFQYREGNRTCRDLPFDSENLESGYYLAKRNETSEAEFMYCDFKIHEVSSCDQLKTTLKVKQPGYYRMRSSVSTQPTFEYCDIIEREDVSTCYGLRKKYGLHEATTYTLKSSPTSQPFKLFCNLSSDKVVTEVSHNIENEIKNPNRCEPGGCYSAAPAYNLGNEHIVEIIASSRECRQYIKVRCTGIIFLNEGYAWWVSRDGDKMNYWGGATSGRDKYCACGETNSCIVQSYKCNCDSNDNNILTEDGGYLTDKSKLPVKEIRLGDQDDAGEQAWHTLGKLECFGEA
uniref:uncharacterized protein LOC120335151 n=1 Tax=Styela clava TaxID=7725 RepID=UPI00193A658A|nr:uncharacterized protein LOC120335151 [Styela clava]